MTSTELYPEVKRRGMRIEFHTRSIAEENMFPPTTSDKVLVQLLSDHPKDAGTLRFMLCLRFTLWLRFTLVLFTDFRNGNDEEQADESARSVRKQQNEPIWAV
jgi:hypothetical protein